MKIIPARFAGGATVVLAAALVVSVTACGAPAAAPSPEAIIASTAAAGTATVTKTVTTAPPAPPRATITTTRTVTKSSTKTVPSTVTKTSTTTVTKSETEQSPASQAPAPTLDSDAAIRAETARAVGVVQRYWSDLFSTWVDPAGKPVHWVEPTLWHGDGFYDSAAGDIASCGNDYDTAGNAFFCGDVGTGTGTAAWDMQLFRNESAFGPLSIYITVGHEMGHAAQTRFVHDGQGPAVLANRELQADCISGATLHKATQDGYLTVDPTDVDTALMAFTDATPGDPHGTAQERRTWFNRGYNGDIESCLGQR